MVSYKTYLKGTDKETALPILETYKEAGLTYCDTRPVYSDAMLEKVITDYHIGKKDLEKLRQTIDYAAASYVQSHEFLESHQLVTIRKKMGQISRASKKLSMLIEELPEYGHQVWNSLLLERSSQDQLGMPIETGMPTGYVYPLDGSEFTELAEFVLPLKELVELSEKAVERLKVHRKGKTPVEYTPIYSWAMPLSHFWWIVLHRPFEVVKEGDAGFSDSFLFLRDLLLPLQPKAHALLVEAHKRIVEDFRSRVK